MDQALLDEIRIPRNNEDYPIIHVMSELTKRPNFAWISLFIFLAAIRLFAAEASWKAGAATVVITPDQPMWMAGYASRTNISQGKNTELYAKALALDDTRGGRLVIVTLDLITVPRALRARLASALASEHGLPQESLLMN